MKGKKIAVILLCVAAIGGVAATVSFKVLSDNKKSETYLEGIDALQQGDYETAKKDFESVGKYQDAAEFLKEVNYQLAILDIQNGNDEEAEKVLLEMADYKDAQNYLYLITYHKVKACMESGEYDQAEAYANEITGYEDVEDLKQEITFQKALVQINEAQFDKAKELLSQVSDTAKVDGAIGVMNYTQYAVPCLQDLRERHPGGVEFVDLLEAKISQVSYNTGATIPLIMLHYSVKTETGELSELYAAYDDYTYFGACHTVDRSTLNMTDKNEVSVFLRIQPNWVREGTVTLSHSAMKILAGM